MWGLPEPFKCQPHKIVKVFDHFVVLALKGIKYVRMSTLTFGPLPLCRCMYAFALPPTPRRNLSFLANQSPHQQRLIILLNKFL